MPKYIFMCINYLYWEIIDVEKYCILDSKSKSDLIFIQVSIVHWLTE